MTADDTRHRWRTGLRLVAGASLLLTLLWASGLTAALDRWWLDCLLRGQTRAPHPDIVIVAIDDRSLAALGRWPWPRSRHAELIRRLDEGGARAIGLDLLLIEPDARGTAEDQALADALRSSGRVVLPTMMQEIDGVPVLVPPHPLFARQARGMGHAHLPLDDDGHVRRVFLREGTAAQPWEAFAAVLRHPKTEPAAPASPTDEATPPHAADLSHTWIRQQPLTIAYAGPSSHFPRVSYVDVLDGRVAPAFWRHKLVLVGVTAVGLGDLFVTPTTQQRALMPGVEVHAHVLDSLLRGLPLAPAPRWQAWLFNLAPAVLMAAALAYGRLGPLAWLGAAVSLALLELLLSGLLHRQALLQLSPWPGIWSLALLGLYHWLRQWQLSIRYLSDELQRFRGGHGPRPETAGTHRLGADPLRHRLLSLRELAQQLRDVHRFVKDSLEALPDAALVCDASGQIQLANAAAAQLAQRLAGLEVAPIPGDRRSRPGDALRDQPVQRLLQALDFGPESGADVFRRLTQPPTRALSAPASGPQAQDFLVKFVPTHNAREVHTGWIVSLIDVTDIHEAQRQRDEAIGFMSHDMRAPQAAILSLLELRRARPDNLSATQFEDRVERHARKALALADGFIQLARAQSHAYTMRECDLGDLVTEAIDDAWELAHKQGVRLRLEGGPAPAPAVLDRELFGRAVGNLLGNAIKFSPAGADVVAAVRPDGGDWVVSVQDQGPGIGQQALDQLFKPFFRDPSAHRVEGAGLGLPLVQAVMLRHGGRVTVHSQPGQGARFELRLPRSPGIIGA